MFERKKSCRSWSEHTKLRNLQPRNPIQRQGCLLQARTSCFTEREAHVKSCSSLKIEDAHVIDEQSRVLFQRTHPRSKFSQKFPPSQERHTLHECSVVWSRNRDDDVDNNTCSSQATGTREVPISTQGMAKHLHYHKVLYAETPAQRAQISCCWRCLHTKGQRSLRLDPLGGLGSLGTQTSAPSFSCLMFCGNFGFLIFSVLYGLQGDRGSTR